MKSQPLLNKFIIVLSSFVCLVISAVFIQFTSKGSGLTFFALPMTVLFLIATFLLLLGTHTNPNTIHSVRLLIYLTLIGLTLLTRVALLPHETDDFIEYLSIWLEDIRACSGFQAFSKDIGNYNMPYFYFLFLLGKLFDQAYDLYVIKFLSILFDYLLAFIILKIVSLKKINNNILAGSFFVTLMIPSVIVNSAMWAQCDSIFTCLSLAGLYFGLKKKSIPCWAMFALALSFKLQSVFLLPILIVLIFTNNIRLKDIWVFFVAFFITLIPAIVFGRSFIDCISIYWKQANTYSELSMVAANVYSWLPVGTRSNIPVALAGVLIAGTVVICFILYLYLRKNKLYLQELIIVAFAFAVMIPFFLPMMHDRYFYLADSLAAVFVFYNPKKWYISAMVIVPSFLCHAATLFNQVVIPMWALSFSILLALCFLLSYLIQNLESKKKVVV